MKKTLWILLLLCGLGFSQTVVSKLNGKRIYMYRQDGGDHQDGYTGLLQQLVTGRAVYGYTFEYAASGLAVTQLDALYDRLYKANGVRDTNTIDILIFCQGQGDRNVGGNSGASPFAGAEARFGKINTHVRSGGGFVMVHAAAGREISWQNWIFGANLMADWFVDNYLASAAFAGNGGHFSAGTQGTLGLDPETAPAMNLSTSFIRKVLTTSTELGGYGKPDSTASAFGEWYHFNASKKYEDGTGGAATNSSNKVAPRQVRGDAGIPDSGIGPLKVIARLTRISSTYIPPGQGRPAVWGREVSAGKFDSTASATNGRFLFFSPGHAANEYAYASGWLRDLLFSSLRWVVKDDRGCTVASDANYNAMATVNAGCAAVSIHRSAVLEEGDQVLGRISADHSSIGIAMNREGAYTLRVVTMAGKKVFSRQGSGVREYRVADLQSGLYMVQVTAGGQSWQKSVFLIH